MRSYCNNFAVRNWLVLPTINSLVSDIGQDWSLKALIRCRQKIGAGSLLRGGRF